jgi:hypothetical protein
LVLSLLCCCEYPIDCSLKRVKSVGGVMCGILENSLKQFVRWTYYDYRSGRDFHSILPYIVGLFSVGGGVMWFILWRKYPSEDDIKNIFKKLKFYKNLKLIFLIKFVKIQELKIAPPLKA